MMIQLSLYLYNIQYDYSFQIPLIVISYSNIMKPKGNVVDQIRKMEEKREERRAKMKKDKEEKDQRRQLNIERGKNVDIDFEILIEKNRFGVKIIQQHAIRNDLKVTHPHQLCVCVRKRPIFKKQQNSGEIDAISAANPHIKIHQPRHKVDGITKYIQNHSFTFDHAFNQKQVQSFYQQNYDIYRCSLHPLMNLLVQDGIITCFAYGQTGSGKTYTMRGILDFVVQQLYKINKGFNTYLSFFQIYGGKCFDLLNGKNNLQIMEDKNNQIQINGLMERPAQTSKQLFNLMDLGFQSRTTHATIANDVSSRSHAICQIVVKDHKEEQIGKLVLVDLAGSQRAQDTQSNNRQRRIQGAQINKSLLALKQCVRAMDDNLGHVPFRASKLTLVLRDSFSSRSNKSRVVMIACISPGSSSADHSLNTLRYADRLKDRSGVIIPQVPPPSQQAINMIFKKQRKGQSIEQSKQKMPQNDSLPHIKQVNNKAQQKKSNKKYNFVTSPSVKPIPKQQIKKVNSKIDNDRGKKQVKHGGRVDSRNQKERRNDSNINSSNNNQDYQQQLLGKNSKRRLQGKKPAKDDVRAMKQTMKGDGGENQKEFFDFHQKVAKILEQQEEIFVVHMAAMKQDAKLLNQQSQLISQVQGVGFMDYDMDEYSQKLQGIIKRKLKMYNLLAKKLQKFKNNLKQQQQISYKVKNTSKNNFYV